MDRSLADDPLAEGLRALRMRGSLFSRAEMVAPFGVRSGPLPFGVFHAVASGRCVLRTPELDRSEPIELVEGDVVYLPHGADHILADTEFRAAAPRSSFGTRPGPDGMEVLHVPGERGGELTTVLCGRVELDEDAIHPVVQLLPDVIHVSRRADEVGGVDRVDGVGGVGAQVPALISLISTELANGGQGAAAMVARLTDVLVLHMVRHHVEHLTDADTGWLRGMGDPLVSQAIALIHKRPDQPWTAAGLAREIGMSRSAFFKRFRELVGEGPIEYLTRWRMHLANHHLREGRSVSMAARSVGYASEASFSDAFLRVTGSRPGSVRVLHRDPLSEEGRT